MRKRDLGLTPWAIQSTSSARRSIGVRSTWSRAMVLPQQGSVLENSDQRSGSSGGLALVRREAAVEGLAVLRHVAQELGRLEPPLAMALGEAVAQRHKG